MTGKHLFVGGLALCVLTMTLSSVLSAEPLMVPEDAARRWLDLVDSDQGANSWAQAGQRFKDKISLQDWRVRLDFMRRSLGRTESRKVANVQLSHSFFGASDGRYALVRFNSAFALKPSAVETVALDNEQNHWLVMGYFVK